MSADDSSPPDDLVTARSLIGELTRTVHQQNQLSAKLQHQLEQLLRQRFGKKSEAFESGQLLLFALDVVEAPAPGPAPESDATPAPATSRKVVASRCRQACLASGSSTTSPRKTGRAPNVGSNAARSARRPASNSSTSPPAS